MVNRMTDNHTVLQVPDLNTAVEKTGAFAKRGEKKKNPMLIDGTRLRARKDTVEYKREQAQQKALTLVQNVFAGDQEIDAGLAERKERIHALAKERNTAALARNKIENRRQSLQESCHVRDNSTEQSELQLLEKEVYARMSGSGVVLTIEERQQIAALKERGLTDYQTKSLEMLETEVPYADTVYQAEQQMKLENQTISATRLERLKSHAMEDAVKQGEEIEAEAQQEIVSMVVDDMKDHVDKEKEQEKERADAAREKQEELQQKKDAARERRKEQERLTENLLEDMQKAAANETDIKDVQDEIKQMMTKMKLVEEDIKGAAVNRKV